MNGKSDVKKPVSVRDLQPKLDAVLGKGQLGQVLGEGLQLLEDNTNAGLRSVRTDVAAAQGASKQARETANEANEKADSAVTTATEAGEKADKALTAAEEAATAKGEVESLTQLLSEVGEKVNGLGEQVSAIDAALTHKVDDIDPEGKPTQTEKKGKDLVAHLLAEIGTLKDALGGFGEKLAQAEANSDEALSKAMEASDLIETARDLVTEVNEARHNEGDAIAGVATSAEEKAQKAEDKVTAINGGVEKAQKTADDAAGKAQSALDLIESLTTAVKEAFENVDGKLQILAMTVLGDKYTGDVQEAMEQPSLKKGDA